MYDFIQAAIQMQVALCVMVVYDRNQKFNFGIGIRAEFFFSETETFCFKFFSSRTYTKIMVSVVHYVMVR